MQVEGRGRQVPQATPAHLQAVLLENPWQPRRPSQGSAPVGLTRQGKSPFLGSLSGKFRQVSAIYLPRSKPAGGVDRQGLLASQRRRSQLWVSDPKHGVFPLTTARRGGRTSAAEPRAGVLL